MQYPGPAVLGLLPHFSRRNEGEVITTRKKRPSKEDLREAGVQPTQSMFSAKGLGEREIFDKNKPTKTKTKKDKKRKEKNHQQQQLNNRGQICGICLIIRRLIKVP